MLDSFLFMRTLATAQAAKDTGHKPKAKKIPQYKRPPLNDSQKVDNKLGMDVLLAHLVDNNYTLPPAELKAAKQFNDNGYATAQVFINGFPVNGDDPWLDPSGKGLSKSMMPHTLQVPTHTSYTYATFGMRLSYINPTCVLHTFTIHRMYNIIMCDRPWMLPGEPGFGLWEHVEII